MEPLAKPRSSRATGTKLPGDRACNPFGFPSGERKEKRSGQKHDAGKYVGENDCTANRETRIDSPKRLGRDLLFFAFTKSEAAQHEEQAAEEEGHNGLELGRRHPYSNGGEHCTAGFHATVEVPTS